MTTNTTEPPVVVCALTQSACKTPFGCVTFGCKIKPAVETATAPSGVDERAELHKKFKLWFFRELSDEQRNSMFRLCDMPLDDEHPPSHAVQYGLLRFILARAALTTPAGAGPHTRPFADVLAEHEADPQKAALLAEARSASAGQPAFPTGGKGGGGLTQCDMHEDESW